MAALEVSVAVSAVASAFHSAAELLKQLKKTRKKRRGEEAYKEKALLESLETGETQIQDQYDADCKELGQSVRIGDAIARERLLHIAVSFQSEVIRSLQIASRNETAVVDLTALHEAAVMHKRDTLAALTELRQRVADDVLPELRQRLGSDAGFRPSLSSSLSGSQRSRSSTYSDYHLPSAVSIPPAEEKHRGVLHRVFSHRRSSSALTQSTNDSNNSEKRNSGYLNVAANMPWISNRGSQEYQDMVNPQSHELPAEVPPRLRPPLMEPPPPPAYSPDRFNRGYFMSDKKIDPAHFPESPRPLHPLERESLEQHLREAQKKDSAVATPEFNRTSADLNEAFNQCMGSLRLDKELRPHSWVSSGASVSSYSHYSSDRHPGDNMTIASTLSADDGHCNYLNTAQPRARHSYTSIQNSSPFSEEAPANELTSPTATAQSHNRTVSAPVVTVIPPQPPRQQSLKATPAPTMLGRPCKANHYYNFCKGAWSLREEFKKGLAIRNKPVGMYTSALIWQCKECTFEGPVFGAKKPYVTDPRVYTYKHTIGDASSSATVTVKYKWIFLAKSHVKVKSSSMLRVSAVAPSEYVPNVSPNPLLSGFLPSVQQDRPSTAADGKSNVVDDSKYLKKPGYSYGCIFCCAEGRVTSVYGNAETLLQHVAEAHAVQVNALSGEAQVRTKCVHGRAPQKDEEWDVWFAGVKPVTAAVDGITAAPLPVPVGA